MITEILLLQNEWPVGRVGDSEGSGWETRAQFVWWSG